MKELVKVVEKTEPVNCLLKTENERVRIPAGALFFPVSLFVDVFCPQRFEERQAQS